MKYMRLNFLIFLILLSACKNKFPTPTEDEVSLGTANLSKINVVGGRSISGFTDGALYNEGQTLSYPRIFIEHISSFSDLNEFNQLSINSENGLNTEANIDLGGVNGRYSLAFREQISNWATRVPINGAAIASFNGDLNSVNDFSIPYSKSYQTDNDQLLIGNPYFDRITNRQNNQSQLDLALSNTPSFIITDFGAEDIFSYALSGAEGDEFPDLNNPVSLENGLTPLVTFKESIESSVNRMLTETDAQVIIATIPDPFKLPYFKDLYWYYVNSEFTRVRSNFSFSFYSDFNNSVNIYNESANPDSTRTIIDFDVDGGERFRAKVIEDEYLPEARDEFNNPIPKIRQMTENDLFLYNGEQTQYNSMIGTVSFGTSDPIPDRYVITSTELDIIDARRNEFNSLIKEISNSNSRIHLLDIEKLIDATSNDLTRFGGTTFSLNFDHRGIISSDGYSLNPKGQALVVNELIRLINDNFNATVPLVDVNSYMGTNYLHTN